VAQKKDLTAEALGMHHHAGAVSDVDESIGS